MINNKKIYKEFCSKENSLPIFFKDWWLDFSAGEKNWQVALVIEEENVIAAMPYIIKKKFGFKLCVLPKFTRFLGPWIEENKMNSKKSFSRTKKIMKDLIKQLPKYDYFLQNWNYDQTNWLPFYWQGFKQTTCYTYVIENLSNIDVVWDNFQVNVRGKIRKSTKRYNLTIDKKPSLETFYELYKKVWENQNIKVPYNKEEFVQLDSTLEKHNSRKIFTALDQEGRPHASVYLVWDNESAYYLMSGSDEELRISGALSFCLWEAIKFSSTVTKKFNFMGSMHEPIETFIRSFGGEQKFTYTITNTKSSIMRFGLSFFNLFK